jgi:DNA-directed RNA polymerase subunit F
MNQGQEKFLGFILERVKEDKVEEAKALLANNFKKQAEGTFTQDDAVQFIPKMVALLKPDKVEEVKAVMKQFSENFRH